MIDFIHFSLGFQVIFFFLYIIYTRILIYGIIISIYVNILKFVIYLKYK